MIFIPYDVWYMLYMMYMTLRYVLLMTVQVVGMNVCVLGGVCMKLADLGAKLLGSSFYSVIY